MLSRFLRPSLLVTLLIAGCTTAPSSNRVTTANLIPRGVLALIREPDQIGGLRLSRAVYENDLVEVRNQLQNGAIPADRAVVVAVARTEDMYVFLLWVWMQYEQRYGQRTPPPDDEGLPIGGRADSHRFDPQLDGGGVSFSERLTRAAAYGRNIVPGDGLELVRLLLKHGGDANARFPAWCLAAQHSGDSLTLRRTCESNGWPALAVAIARADTQMVSLLLEHGADPNAPFVARSYYIHRLPGPLAVAEWEVKLNQGKHVAFHGLQPDVSLSSYVEPDELSTPLILAVHSNNARIVELLLDHSADRSAVDSNGLTAAMHANELGHVAIEALLRGHPR